MKLSNKLEERTSPLFGIILQKMKELHPERTHPSKVPTTNLVGAMILSHMVNHFIVDEQLQILSAMYVNMVGPVTGLRAPRDGESFVSLIDQLNN